MTSCFEVSAVNSSGADPTATALNFGDEFFSAEWCEPDWWDMEWWDGRAWKEFSSWDNSWPLCSLEWSKRKQILMASWDIHSYISILVLWRVFSTVGRYHHHFRGCSLLWRWYQKWLWLTLNGTKISSIVLMMPPTELMVSPTVLSILHSTAETFPGCI